MHIVGAQVCPDAKQHLNVARLVLTSLLSLIYMMQRGSTFRRQRDPRCGAKVSPTRRSSRRPRLLRTSAPTTMVAASSGCLGVRSTRAAVRTRRRGHECNRTRNTLRPQPIETATMFECTVLMHTVTVARYTIVSHMRYTESEGWSGIQVQTRSTRN